MTTEAPPLPPTSDSRGRRIAIAFGIIVAVVVIYVLSLIAVHLLAKSAPPLPAVDFSKLRRTTALCRSTSRSWTPSTTA